MNRKYRRNQNINRVRNKLDNQIKQEKKLLTDTFNGTTLGTVVNSDDPQQMGRLQIFCPSLGDLSDHPVEDLPWAIYAPPFAGITSYGTRGNEDDEIDGSTAYGMWSIPKFGSQVLVTTIDGNPDYRVWLGCIYGQFLSHTLPNGRYFDKKDENGRILNENDGPLASNETPIQPTYKNLEEAFGPKSGNYEWKSRGMDNQTSNVDNRRLKETNSKVADDTNRGYSKNRQLSEYNLQESSITSITTPGQHVLSMDDKTENCRIKLRTTSGHTILMDDTNERIYISTAKGENWIELDQVGNIDMYTSGNFSVHAEKDINFTSDKSIKMYAKDGIHLKSEDQIKIQSNKDLNIKSNKNLNIKSSEDINSHIVGNYKLQVDGTTDILSGNTLTINTNSTLYVKSMLNTFINGAQTFLNSSAPNNIVIPFSTEFTETSYIPSRVPEHEPWGRISTKVGLEGNESLYNTNTLIGLGSKVSSSVLELSYDDENVGKVDRDTIFNRGKNWKR